MTLIIYKWGGDWLRRAAFPDRFGNPGWALSQACCCGECCAEWPNILDISVSVVGCTVVWNLPNWQADSFSAATAGCPDYTQSWGSTDPTESGTDCPVNWKEFCIWCDEDGNYWLQMQGIGTGGGNYGLPINCGPHLATSVVCISQNEWQLDWTFDCDCGDGAGACTFNITAVPNAGAAWN